MRGWGHILATFQRTTSPDCPLGHGDATHVPGEGSIDAQVCFIGEAPGAVEDREGRPFLGPAGRALDAALSHVGLRREAVWVTNVLCCRPPSNNIDSLDAQDALSQCGYGNLARELAALRSLKVVVPLGNTALEALGLQRGIRRQRGSVYEHKLEDGRQVLVMPTLHPAAILRQSIDRPLWIADLKKAKSLLDGHKVPKERFVTHPTLAQVEELLSGWAAEEGALAAVDIETTGLMQRQGQIICVGVAIDGGRALCIPFLKQGGDSYWSEADEYAVHHMLGEFLQKVPTIFQNALFDVPWLEHAHLPVKEVRHDILLLHHAINPELPHDLGNIVSVYGATPYWKSTLTGRMGRAIDVPDEELRTYNCRDCVVLHQVLPGLLADLAELGTEASYRQISMALLAPIAHMKKAGLLLSKHRLQEWKRELERKTVELEGAIRDDGALDPAWSPSSDDDVRLFLFGWHAPKFARARKKLDERIIAGKRKNTKVHRELESLVRVAESTRPILTRDDLQRIPTARTDGGRISVDRQARLRIQIWAQGRLDSRQELVRRTPEVEAEEQRLHRLVAWLRLFGEYKETAKLLSTYTDYRADPDGRVRSDYLVHGTATGRLSSRNPNAQNIPKAARRLFVTPSGSLFVSADYSNLELRLAAYISGDRELIAAFERGENVHDNNCRILFGLDPGDEQWDAARRAAKVYIFGRNYGGGIRSIFERVAMAVPELGITERRFKEADERYRAAHPQYTAWVAAITDEVKRTRRLTNIFGRVRRFMGSDYDIVKEGVNFPIQSAAADIINRALIRFYEYMRGDRMDVMVCAQIHDALLLEVKKGVLNETCWLLKEVMELPVRVGKHRVVFPVDISVGRDWLNLEEYVIKATAAA